MLIVSSLLTIFIIGMIALSVVAAVVNSARVPAIQPVSSGTPEITDDQIMDWVIKEGQPGLVQGLQELDEEMDYSKELFI